MKELQKSQGSSSFNPNLLDGETVGQGGKTVIEDLTTKQSKR